MKNIFVIVYIIMRPSNLNVVHLNFTSLKIRLIISICPRNMFKNITKGFGRNDYFMYSSIYNKMEAFLSSFLDQPIDVDSPHTTQLVWPQGFGQQENPLVRCLQEEGLSLGCHPGRLLNKFVI